MCLLLLLGEVFYNYLWIVRWIWLLAFKSSLFLVNFSLLVLSTIEVVLKSQTVIVDYLFYFEFCWFLLVHIWHTTTGRKKKKITIIKGKFQATFLSHIFELAFQKDVASLSVL